MEEKDMGRIVSKDDCFGLSGFFTGRELIQQAKSIGFTSVLRISRQAVMQIIKKQKKDLQIFKQIGDQIQYERNLSCLGIKCNHCNSFDHEARNCIYLHFDKQNPFIIYKYNVCLSQERDSNFIRGGKMSNLNSLRMNNIVQSKMDQFRIDNGFCKFMEQSNCSSGSIQDILQPVKKNSILDPMMRQSIKQQEEREYQDDDILKDQRRESYHSFQSLNLKDDIKEQTASYYFKNKDELFSPSDIPKNLSHLIKNQDVNHFEKYYFLFQCFLKYFISGNTSFNNNDPDSVDESNKIAQSLDKKGIKKNLIVNTPKNNLSIDKQSSTGHLYQKSKSQMQLASEYSQKQKTFLSKDTQFGLNPRTISLILPLSNIIKNFNNQIDTQNHLQNQQYYMHQDWQLGLEMDTLHNFDFYFRYYNSNNVLKRQKQVQAKQILKKKLTITQNQFMNIKQDSSKFKMNS